MFFKWDHLQSLYSRSCFLIQLNPDKTKVKRITQIQEPVNVDERTVYVVGSQVLYNKHNR